MTAWSRSRLRYSRSACAGLLPLLFVWMLPVVVSAQFNYVTNDGTITIIRYAGPGGDVTIPGAIHDLPVTSIGDSAFFRSTNLTSVTIPDSVTSIGSYAFWWCTNLTSITIGSSVTNIGDRTFYGCSKLTNISIPDTVSHLGSEAFSFCSGLKAITVPDRVTTISYRVFADCSNLTSFIISDSVTTLGEGAFLGCTGLTNVIIGKGVTIMGGSPFDNCRSLMAIEVDPHNSYFSSLDGVVFSKDQTLLIECPEGKAGSYTIPDSVTNIGGSAFSFCASLTSVTIPDHMTSIGERVFYYCTSLTNMIVPDRVMSIGYRAFRGCSSLTGLIIGNSVTIIGESAFSDCTNLTSVIVPDRVTRIGDYAFLICPNLTSVYFKGNAPESGADVFIGSKQARVYYLPGTVGWGPMFGNRATALWRQPNPQILSLPPAFGVQNDQFGFRISWATNAAVVVEASTDLANPTWSPISTNIITIGVDPSTDGWSYFIDANWANRTSRFYRVRSP